jgi:hypothetical protein
VVLRVFLGGDLGGGDSPDDEESHQAHRDTDRRARPHVFTSATRFMIPNCLLITPP